MHTITVLFNCTSCWTQRIAIYWLFRFFLLWWAIGKYRQRFIDLIVALFPPAHTGVGLFRKHEAALPSYKRLC